MFRLFLVLSFLIFIGCSEKYTPKPYGYFRIDFPDKAWQLLTADSLPFEFEMAATANLENDTTPDADRGWLNLAYPQYNAKIHLSYKKISSDTSLIHYLEDAHRMAYTHTVKAESIDEKYFRKGEIFGLVYYIEGNTASSTQFFITDSTGHFLRGALYFNQHPDKDSLAPVISYLREDVINLMESLRFK